jgi:DNA-binding transcriptional LysR family regulator
LSVAIELRHLRYFVAVAEELHFGRAARRLFLSQPSLSSQIRQLEAEVGCPLFERTTREVRLTPAGEALLAHARELLAGVERALLAARGAAGVLKGELRLRCSFGGQHAVEPLLGGFRAAHPAVVTHVLLGHDAELLEEVRAGRADGAFVWEFEEDAELETLLVVAEPGGVVLPVGHRLADLAVVPREELRGERVVLFEREIGPRIVRRLEWLLWGEGEPPEELIVRIRASTAAQEALQDAVAEGRGISLVTKRVFELGHPADTVYRPLDPPFAGRLFFVWRPDPAPLRDALVRALGSAES